MRCIAAVRYDRGHHVWVECGELQPCADHPDPETLSLGHAHNCPCRDCYIAAMIGGR